MSLYEQIGGEPAVNAAVDLFYTKVLADDLLAPHFGSVNMDGQSRKQKAFFTTIFRGETDGAATYMRKAHKGMDIGDDHFNAVAGHLQATLEELNVPADLIAQIMGAAGGLRDAVLDR